MRVLTAIALALVLATACSVDNELRYQIQDYSIRLGRLLDEPLPDGKVTPPPNLPRIRDLIEDPGELETLNPLEYLRLGDCELQNLIAAHNSALGRLATPSQRMVYEIRFLALVGDCRQLIAVDTPELDAILFETAQAKRDRLPAVIWQATLGGAEFRTLWQMHLPTRTPSLPSGLGLTLSRLAVDIEQWLAGDYRIDSGRFESMLDEVRRAQLGQHLRQWLVVSDEMAVATQILESRASRRPLCFPGMDTSAGEILNNVVRQRLVGVIQPEVARLNRDYHDIFPAIRRLEAILASGEPASYTTWRLQRDALVSDSLEAMPMHIRALSPLLSQCGLLPK